jgi:hypothetical protein
MIRGRSSDEGSRVHPVFQDQGEDDGKEKREKKPPFHDRFPYGCGDATVSMVTIVASGVAKSIR